MVKRGNKSLTVTFVNIAILVMEHFILVTKDVIMDVELFG